MDAKMTSKIRIKLGPIEVEYEGSEDFLKEELPRFLEAVSNLYKQSGLPAMSPAGASGGGAPQLQGTTGSIAAKLLCKTGPDLIMAAAARLTFVAGQETFNRKDLLKEMKAAKAYYKTSHRDNLTGSLNGLTKDGKLLEIAKDTYSLSANSKSELGAKLA